MEGIINIAGVMPRIGTTTLALQLILFLKENGYEAAYVEMGTENYLWAVENMYENCIADKQPGKITCEGIELYNKSRMKELTAGGSGYDYLVCDYGNLQADGFSLNAFNHCTATILAAGMKANEVFYTQQALKNAELKDAFYLFNFVSKKEQADIKTMMGNKAALTAFAPYMPDPFTWVPEAESCYLAVMDHVVAKAEGRR